MHDVWVVNASPLIVLAKVGYLHLLERLAVETLIPPGLHLDDEAVAVALREIGETWQGRSA